MKRLALVLFSLLLVLGAISPCAAEEKGGVVRLYVSLEGNDRFSGSEQYPFATLEKALKTLRLLEERGVIYLRAGTYEGGVFLGEEDRLVTVRSYPGEQVIVRAKGGKPALTMQGCITASVQGISFTGGSGAEIRDCTGALVADCEFSDMIRGIDISGNARIENNVIQNIGGSGVIADSGQREGLEQGNCVIVNNTIRSFSQNGLNEPGVLLKGVGVVLSHNDISDGSSCAVEITGNNHLVQNNKISRIDAPGAVCTQADVTARGSKIKNNMIRDCSECGVLLGEFSSGITLFGNVFYRLNQSVRMLGGRNNSFQNNLSVDCGGSLSLETVSFPYAKRKEMQSQLEQVAYQEGQGSEEYPQLENLMKDQPGTPKYNCVSGNLVFQTPAAKLHSQVEQYGQVEADTVLADASVFRDYEAGDFTMKNRDFSCDEIGSKQEKLRQLTEQSVVLGLNCWSAVKYGADTPIDSANHRVTPTEYNGRTLVPIRFVAESLGAQVEWNGKNQLVTIEKGNSVVSLIIGSQSITVNGEIRELDTAAIQKNNRTLVPLRAVAEAFGQEVLWDPSGLIVISETAVDLEDELIKQALYRRIGATL
ncbi:MAG: stalk domain-containing protein [Clostridia bacterium]|nr:stalk domain-containing protein [Clostridia bacterium]